MQIQGLSADSWSFEWIVARLTQNQNRYLPGYQVWWLIQHFLKGVKALIKEKRVETIIPFSPWEGKAEVLWTLGFTQSLHIQSVPW